MTDEDFTAAKLKGYTVYVKFKDGEILFLKPDLDNPDEYLQWFYDAEKFINGSSDVEYFPISGIAMTRDTIKYVKEL